jgi:hypothetical protein
MCKMWISCAQVSVILIFLCVHSSGTKPSLKECHLGIEVVIKNCMKISVTEIIGHMAAERAQLWFCKARASVI